jgi:transcriptional regulator with XRE-family HTH domain
MTGIAAGYFSARELGSAFRAERKALGFTQQQVADKCRFRRATISEIEAGKNVELFTLMTALTALGKGLSIVDRRISRDQLSGIFDEED